MQLKGKINLYCLAVISCDPSAHQVGWSLGVRHHTIDWWESSSETVNENGKKNPNSNMLLWKSVRTAAFTWSSGTANMHYRHKVVVITSGRSLHSVCVELSSVFVPRATICLQINKVVTFKKDLLMVGRRVKLDPLMNTLAEWQHHCVTVHEALPRSPAYK